MTRRRGHGEGSIYQRADGKWAAALDLGLQNGRRARKVLYGATRREVSEKLARALTDLQDGFAPPDRRVTLGDWLERHLNNAETTNELGHATLLHYRAILRNYVIPALGTRRLVQLSPQLIQEYQAGLLRRELAVKTITLHRALLSRGLNEAVRFGMIHRNVVSLVKPPKAPENEEPVGKSLPPDHVRALMETARGDSLWPFYALCLTAGLRRGEALGLTWEDVEFPSGSGPGIVHIRRQLQQRDGVAQRVKLKSKYSQRDIPIPPVTVDALWERHEAQQAEFDALGRRWWPSDLVLTTPAGEPVHRNTIVKQFHKHRRDAELPYCRPHDLRHTYGSLLMSQGVPLKTISELMGHASVDITANIYLHSLQGQVLDTANVVQRALELPGAQANACPTCGRAF